MRTQTRHIKHLLIGLAALCFTAESFASCNSVDFGGFPASGTIVTNGTSFSGTVHAFADYGVTAFGSSCGNSWCGQQAQITASGSCRFNDNNGFQDANSGRGGCGDRRAQVSVQIKPGNVAGGNQACTITAYARHDGQHLQYQRTVLLAQSVAWTSWKTDNETAANTPAYSITGLAKTSDGLGNTGQPVTFTSLTAGVCTVSGSTVTNVSPGTCTIRAIAQGSSSFGQSAHVDRSWVVSVIVDNDLDGVLNTTDNCVDVVNADQLNTDGDAQGNACDSDDDNDLVSDALEALEGTDPVSNTSFNDSDADGTPDYIESTGGGDSDGDGVNDALEPGGTPYADGDSDGVPAYLDDNDGNASIGNADGHVQAAFRPRGNVNAAAAFQNAGYSDGVTPTRVYVNVNATGNGSGGNWANATTNLVDALDFASVDGDEVWIAQGVYKPTTSSDVNIRFDIGSSISVYGGFFGTETEISQANSIFYPTILSGDIDNNDDETQITNGVLTDASGINGNNTGAVLRVHLAGNTAPEAVTIKNITVTAGSASGFGGGGIQITSNAYVIMDNITVVGNRANEGGGIAVLGNTTAILSNMRIMNNAANMGGVNSGGGIAVKGSGADSTLLTISESVISGNSAVANAGGIWIDKNGATGTVKADLVNTTVTGNSGNNYGGYGIVSGAESSCNYCTVVNNTATVDAHASGIALTGSGSKLTLARSAIANTDRGTLTSGWDLYIGTGTVIVDNGYNAIGSSSEAGIVGAFGTVFNSGTSFINNQPISTFLNDTLGSYGGKTKALVVRSDSDLRDAIPSGQCGAVNKDQRGYSRPFGTGCDIGAVEYTDVNGFCWDDGAVDNSRPVNDASQVFCAGSFGDTLNALTNNLVTGGSTNIFFLLLLSLGFTWRFKRNN